MDLESLKQFATPRQCVVIDAVIEHGSNNKAAEALNIDKRGLIRTLKRAKASASKQGWSPDHDMTHPVPDTHIVKGVSTFYDENGTPIRQWVKSDLKKESQELLLQAFADGLMEELPKYKPIIHKPADGVFKTLTAYVIGDAHIGMKTTSARNRGEGEWNLEVAERVTIGAVEKLIQASGGGDTGLMLDLGDFQHADNAQNTTTSGTQLDVDGEFGDTIDASVRIYRHSIDMMLAVHSKVILMMVRGNHNSNTSRVINRMLNVFYENEPRVEVMDNAHKFQSLTYGNNLLVTHHGDRMKPERAHEYIARSMYKEWGQCEHRHLLMGHIHHSVKKEVGGLMAEFFQALPSGDAWHSDNGFGAKRSMTCIVYDKKHGEVQRHKVGIDQIEEVA